MDLEGYRPGYYPGRSKDFLKLSEEMAKSYELSRVQEAETGAVFVVHPCISISRKIGVGALEVADKISTKLNMKVIDRELMERLAEHLDPKKAGNLSLDERVPSLGEDILRMLSGKKVFLRSKYAKALASIIFWAARTGPSIFVGRGAHLMLPRDKVLAVKIIAPIEYRAKRVSAIMKTGYLETERKLREFDKDQKAFFKKLYGKSSSSPYEFDMVINRVFLEEIDVIADTIISAYKGKFKKKEVL